MRPGFVVPEVSLLHPFPRSWSWWRRGAGAAPIASAGLAVAVAEEEVWISLENLPPYSMGQIVINPGMVLPAGHVSLETDKALILINEGRSALAIKKINNSELSTFTAKDLRVLPI